ncbi:hypothetical protein EZV62_023003 [Acer yangbiense]|uniref:Prolamin-like domain-containing protein n=1 Tax=Acer yangbiense TaxID=1000413 RepID=A0A5C7H0X6_9ROSI|nr:hypothetical protein EZV62_023003 [Acer yangbiense]
MMKGVVTVLIFFIICSTSSIQATSAADVEVEPAWYWYGRGEHPPLQAPNKSPGHPFFSDPKVKKCPSDLPSVHTCMRDIYKSFWNHNAASNLKPECCSAVQKLDKDCSSTVFKCFNNPFFSALLEDLLC